VSQKDAERGAKNALFDIHAARTARQRFARGTNTGTHSGSPNRRPCAGRRLGNPKNPLASYPKRFPGNCVIGKPAKWASANFKSRTAEFCAGDEPAALV